MKFTPIQKKYIKGYIFNRIEFDRTHPDPIHRQHSAFSNDDTVKRVEWSKIMIQFDDYYEIPFKTYLEKQTQYYAIKVDEFDAEVMSIIRDKKLKDLGI